MILHCTFTAESDSERILKIGQHLPKLWAIKYRVVFLWNMHGVHETQLGLSACLCDTQAWMRWWGVGGKQCLHWNTMTSREGGCLGVIKYVFVLQSRTTSAPLVTCCTTRTSWPLTRQQFSRDADVDDMPVNRRPVDTYKASEEFQLYERLCRGEQTKVRNVWYAPARHFFSLVKRIHDL